MTGEAYFKSEAEKEAIFQGLLDTMGDVDDLVRLFRGMIFATDGVGKTVLAMMIAQLITPPDKQIAFIDSHNGFKVIGNSKWKARGLGQRTRRFQFDGYSQIEAMSEFIQLGEMPFGTVVLDELSYMVGVDIQRIHTQHVKANKKDTDEDVPGWGEYNPAKNRYLKMMEKLLEAGTHVIAVSHRREEMNKAKQQLFMPDFIPSIRKQILRPFDFCGYMTADIVTPEDSEVIEYERTVQVHPTKLITGCKTKIDDLPLLVDSMDLPGYIKEWLNEERSTNDADNNVYSDPSTVIEDDDDRVEVI